MSAFYQKTATASYTILSLEDAKKQLKVEDLGTFDDDLIYDCIDAAIEEAESYINSHIQQRTYTIKFSEWPVQDYEFRRQIIQSVEAIAYKDTNGDAQTLVVADTVDVVPIDKYAQIIHFKDYSALPSLKPEVIDAVTITVKCGYASGTVPKGLLQGIKLLVSENYNIRNNIETKGYRTAAHRKLEPYKYYAVPIGE